MSKSAVLLLPCPWCGSEKMLLEDGYDEHECNDFPFIRCKDCGAAGPSFLEDPASAIAAWNKGPYADRFEIHAKALEDHAAALKAQATPLCDDCRESLARVKARVCGGGVLI